MARRTNQKHEYRFKAGSRLPKAQAQEVGEHLNAISKKADGTLTAETVLSDAAKKRSPIHDFFEWDDTIAAGKHRMEQARHLIRCVEVIYSDVPEQSEPCRAFVTIRDCETLDPSDYVSTYQIMSNADHRTALLVQARREMREWASRYRHLAELAEVIAVIDKSPT